MPAAISEFVDINVLVAAATPTRFSFGNYQGTFEHNVTTDRQNGPYFSVAEGVLAGFTEGAAPEVYYWMSAAFSQDDAVDSVLVGRKIAATGGPFDRVWQYTDIGPAYADETTDANDPGTPNWIIFPAAEATDDACIIGSAVPFSSVTFDSTGGTAGTVGVVVWEYWNGVAWAALTGVTDNTNGFTAGLGSGQVLSFTQPVDWATQELDGSGGQLYYIQARITTVYTIDPVYDSGFITGDADWSDALDQIVAVAGDASFYGFSIESRVKADILDVAAWSEANGQHMFVSQSADADFLNGTAGNVALTMQGLYKRSVGPIYHATSSGSANGYLDGAWASSGFGMDLDIPGGRGIWAYRQLEGITYDAVTSTQATNIYGADGNLYGRNLGLSFTSKGTTAFGVPYFIDIQTTIDWIKTRLEEDILSAFVAANVIPYTNAGIATLVAVVKARLDQGITFGHFSPDFEPVVTAPLASAVSTEDKQTRELTMSAEAMFAGAVQKLTLTLNLTF